MTTAPGPRHLAAGGGDVGRRRPLLRAVVAVTAAVATGAAGLGLSLATPASAAGPAPAAVPAPAAASPASASPASAVATALRTATPDHGQGRVGPVRLTGPLPVTATSYPFGAAAHTRVPEDLRRIGYVEDEYLVSGRANIYTWPKPGPAVVRTPDAPYTTRILVRRPAKASRFSGTVVVEPLNPSNLFDLNLGWGLMHDQLVRSGDIWVGVTIKPVAMQTLKTFDPVRYRSLAMDNPLPLSDPRNCTTVPSDSSRTTENGLAWDIYTQVGQLVRAQSPRNPVSYGARAPRHGLKVYSFGYSQTGGYLYDYINAVQPRVVAATGRDVYDAYLVAVAGGDFAGLYPINQCEAVPPVDDPRRQLSGVGTPVIHVMSQSDYLRGIASRRPDSDAPSDRYRGYEMAGAGHATPGELNYAAQPADIVKGGRAVPPMDCNEGPRSRFPSQIFFDAMLANLDRWVRDGVAPPHGSPIVVRNGEPVLDRFGNVTGGLRSPYLDVPTSTWFGSSTGASFCFIAGHEVPFSKGRLAELYPSHADYVRKVAADVRSLVQQRFVTRYDGRMLVQEARAADVP